MSYKILNISKFSNSHSIFSSPSVSPASHAGYCSVYVLRIHSQPKRALPHYTPQAKYSLFIQGISRSIYAEGKGSSIIYYLSSMPQAKYS